MFCRSEWQVRPSLICIAVVGGDDLPGEDGLQEVEVVGEPGGEGAVEVSARVAVAAGPPETRRRITFRSSCLVVVLPLRETVHFTCGEAMGYHRTTNLRVLVVGT